MTVEDQEIEAAVKALSVFDKKTSHPFLKPIDLVEIQLTSKKLQLVQHLRKMNLPVSLQSNHS